MLFAPLNLDQLVETPLDFHQLLIVCKHALKTRLLVHFTDILDLQAGQLGVWLAQFGFVKWVDVVPGKVPSVTTRNVDHLGQVFLNIDQLDGPGAGGVV